MTNSFFEMFFYGTMGSILANTIIGLVSIILFISGYTLIKKYNKKDTKPLDQIQKGQYIGILLCGISILPWVRYLIAGFGIEAGERVFNELF